MSHEILAARPSTQTAVDMRRLMASVWEAEPDMPTGGEGNPHAFLANVFRCLAKEGVQAQFWCAMVMLERGEPCAEWWKSDHVVDRQCAIELDGQFHDAKGEIVEPEHMEREAKRSLYAVHANPRWWNGDEALKMLRVFPDESMQILQDLVGVEKRLCQAQALAQDFPVKPEPSRPRI